MVDLEICLRVRIVCGSLLLDIIDSYFFSRFFLAFIFLYFHLCSITDTSLALKFYLYIK